MHKEHCYRTKSISLFRELSILLFSFLTLLGILITLPVYSEESAYDLFTPPGELINIGSHRLHINCKGTGTPTVIIDSGMGGFSLEWKNIQETLSNHVTTCTYDRAGYGWSDFGPSPRTSSQIANELHRLIEAKKLSGPFILVGHSFGGYNMRSFASKYSKLVAGMVLIDSSHPEQFDRMDLKPLVTKKVVRPNTVSITISRPIMHTKYPKDVKGLAYALMTTQKSHYARMDELENFEISAHQIAKTELMPDVPLIILTRGKRVWPLNDRGEKMEAVWEEMQSELCYLSDISIQVIAKNSGHSIHLDQPLLTSSAILNTVAASRKIKEEKLARLAEGKNPLLDHQQATLYNYFEFPLIGGQVNYNTETIYHGISTVYYDATYVSANLK